MHSLLIGTIRVQWRAETVSMQDHRGAVPKAEHVETGAGAPSLKRTFKPANSANCRATHLLRENQRSLMWTKRALTLHLERP